MRVTALIVIITMLAAAAPARAEQPVPSGELRHEAFVRGGKAIGEALNTRLVLTALETPLPSQQPAQMQAEENGKKSKVLLWVGIGIGVAISAFLIQRSVTKHRRIFAPGL
jgi:hypothetical protein